LLEAGQTTVRLALGRRLLDRFRQIEELDQIARNIDRIGHDPANILAQDLFQFSFPFARKGSAVAITTSLAVTRTGRMLKRAA